MGSCWCTFLAVFCCERVSECDCACVCVLGMCVVSDSRLLVWGPSQPSLPAVSQINGRHKSGFIFSLTIDTFLLGCSPLGGTRKVPEEFVLSFLVYRGVWAEVPWFSLLSRWRKKPNVKSSRINFLFSLKKIHLQESLVASLRSFYLPYLRSSSLLPPQNTETHPWWSVVQLA